MVAALCILAAVLLLLIFLIFPGRGCREMREVFFHRNVAHRGLHTGDSRIPENSLPAFKAAAEAGFAIEFDLQLSKDGQVVVFHDDTLNRVCGIDNRVDFYTYEELCGFGLCGTDEKIPLFSELLELVDGRVPLLIEFKNGPKNKELCGKAYELIRKYRAGGFSGALREKTEKRNYDLCIESFSPIIVRWFRKNAPEIMRGQLACPIKDYRGSVGLPLAILLSNVMLNCLGRPHFVAYDVHKRSIPVKLCDLLGAMRFVWTVRPDNDIRTLERKNDSIIFELYRPENKW